MNPLSLRLSGFLSYRDPVELDFTAFDLACISGPNGAGKSSLLDAMTWALFGQARKNGEALINAQSQAAEVVFTFEYEGNVYRVQRSLPRGKSTLLEFQIEETADKKRWRPLTEHTMRETQARIEHILRLDYETFVNSSFFLQGKADQFTQQSTGRRKEVLASILGLEIWEVYRERAAARRKEIERELDEIEGRMAEIEAELTEEASRKARLAALESDLERLSAARKLAESTLEAARRAASALAEQSRLVESLHAALTRSEQNLAALEGRLVERQEEYIEYTSLLARAEEIQRAYQVWQEARDTLTRWEETAAQFHQYEAQRHPLLEQIAIEKARLEQEQQAFTHQSQALKEQFALRPKLETQLETERKALEEAEALLAEREAFDQRAAQWRERQAELKAENQELKTQMEELKARIDRLKAVEGAACPLCGQPLSEEHRLETLAHLEAEGKTKGDRYRANLAESQTIEKSLLEYTSRLPQYAAAEQARQAASASIARITEKLESLQASAKEWESGGALRLTEVTRLLENDTYAEKERRLLETLDAELKALGYDPAAHETARQAEVQGRTAEADFRALEMARAASAPLEREIADLQSQTQALRAEVEKSRNEYEQAARSLAEAQSQAPDVEATEKQVFGLQEQENRLHQEVGAARQAVAVLDVLRQRKAGLEAQSQELRRQIGQHKTLERAFSKDGVPALLIEQALPQIEEKANELLDRLSNGMMSVRFVTQAGYKDKKREDLKETLDIIITDVTGERDYEMFSGGEAFRVNFAIRLALSEVLAQRKGARLQMLVIDEGFGSQDVQGRQRLIEAINLVRGGFAKILVITHLDELKDAFPTRIEVEKTEQGSRVTVL